MADNPPRVVTRFAPSPTGYLHIGGARTALFNWAFARKHGGTFILRIEDTDKARSTPEATRRIIEDLQWLGIDWDQGPDPQASNPYDTASQKGEHGPYFQSQREHLYREYLQRLLDLGRAYPDGDAYRFKMPGEAVTVHDLVLGDVTIQPENLEDFIIMKGASGGGGPTFHFANVVDDATMGVTHVLRAQEHLMNTPKHVAMFDALGIARPSYAHMPLIFNADGSKMSKRDKAKTARKAALDWIAKGNEKAELIRRVLAGVAEIIVAADGGPTITADSVEQFLAKKNDEPTIAGSIAYVLGASLPEIDVHDFRVTGYLPGVVLNYIALLGWSPADKDAVGERFDRDFVAQHFAVEGIGRSNAKFDRTKLLAFNGETLQKMPPDEFRALLREHLRRFHPQYNGITSDAEKTALFAAAYQPRTRVLDDPAIAGRFFVIRDDAVEFDAKAVDKVIRKNENAGLKVLCELADVLRAVDPWTPNAIHEALEKFAAATGRGMGDVAQPLRAAVTGTTVSPAIHDTLAILGKEATLNRITVCQVKL